MTDWLISTPEFDVLEDDLLGYGQGPLITVRDCVVVRTDLGPREAKICAVTAWLSGKEPGRYLLDNRGFGNPFAALTAERLLALDGPEFEDRWEWGLA